MLKVCIVTSTRAEFGLFTPLIKEIKDSSKVDLKLIATGSHLSEKYGMTINEIKSAGFNIDLEVPINIDNDSATSLSKAMGETQIKFTDALNQLAPDLLLLLGDRFEILPIASAATMLSIPIGHIHGGELSEGAIDDSIRHCLSKLSHVHFTACDEYKKRVIQLGEAPERVFNTGALCGDNILGADLLTKKEILEDLGIEEDKNIYLITYHPVTRETSNSEFQNLIDSLKVMENPYFIFTYPNFDTENQPIIDSINSYVKANNGNSSAHKSLGMKRYLSLMSISKGVIGNSSSGIIEAPFFNVPTLNIGKRQSGRVRAASIIDCESDLNSITKGLKSLESYQLKDSRNPFGKGGAAKKICQIIEQLDMDRISKKRFFDLE